MTQHPHQHERDGTIHVQESARTEDVRTAFVTPGSTAGRVAKTLDTLERAFIDESGLTFEPLVSPEATDIVMRDFVNVRGETRGAVQKRVLWHGVPVDGNVQGNTIAFQPTREQFDQAQVNRTQAEEARRKRRR